MSRQQGCAPVKDPGETLPASPSFWWLRETLASGWIPPIAASSLSQISLRLFPLQRINSPLRAICGGGGGTPQAGNLYAHMQNPGTQTTVWEAWKGQGWGGGGQWGESKGDIGNPSNNTDTKKRLFMTSPRPLFQIR